MLEITCHCPSSLQHDIPRESLLTFFGKFWQQDLPRFGEVGAKGWSDWHSRMEEKLKGKELNMNYDPTRKTPGIIDVMDEENSMDDVSSSSDSRDMKDYSDDSRHNSDSEDEEDNGAKTLKDKFEPEDDSIVQDRLTRCFSEWAKEEKRLQRDNWLPARDVNEDEDNLERVVFFEDIQKYLCQLTYPDLKLELLYRFLEFLGLQLPGRVSTNSLIAKARSAYMEDAKDQFRLLELVDFPEINSRGIDKNENTQDRRLLKKIDWTLTYTVQPINNEVKRNLLRTILLQASEIYPKESNLQKLRLLLEGSYDIALARQSSKEMLQKNVNYGTIETYALLEQSHNIKRTRKMYNAVLSDAKPSVRKSRPGLVRAFAEFELSQQNENNALSILLSLTNNETFTPVKSTKKKKKQSAALPATTVLKARKVFEDEYVRHKAAIEPQTAKCFVDFTICYALFAYMTTKTRHTDKLEKAELIFKDGITAIAAHEVECERLATAYVHVIRTHCIKLPTPPYYLRVALMFSLRIFPENAFFISLFMESEARSLIAGRMRRFFDEICSNQSSPLLWLFSIRSEIRQGSMHRIRGLFERALAKDSASRNSVVLWKYYLNYELENDTEKAKGVFYRAIQNVPWCKSIWLLGIDKLRMYFSVGQLHDLIKLMAEKELRLESTTPE
mmetsp:Transcript_18065/g.20118  ORF Transcript_18065/g.20118 Transcript_18065/m.20118 type:complete len:671 (+) Transcript_18065:1-2013(+)